MRRRRGKTWLLPPPPFHFSSFLLLFLSAPSRDDGRGRSHCCNACQPTSSLFFPTKFVKTDVGVFNGELEWREEEVKKNRFSSFPPFSPPPSFSLPFNLFFCRTSSIQRGMMHHVHLRRRRSTSCFAVVAFFFFYHHDPFLSSTFSPRSRTTSREI